MAEKPFLAAAFLCEKILQEKDDVLTATRIVDTFSVSIPANLPTSTKPAIAVSGLLSFKKASPGVEAERHQVELRMHLPSGKEQPPAKMDLVFKPGEFGGANLILNLQIPAEEFGTYRLAVFLDGEPVTQIPFRLLEKPANPPETIR